MTAEDCQFTHQTDKQLGGFHHALSGLFFLVKAF
jgi:hypothetical protein